jgi:tRNA (mo5U34)-methyltransferase
LGSNVDPVVLDFATDDLSDLGTFDVVIFAGVLYHLENPVGALRRLAALTREIAVVRTVAVHFPRVTSAAWEFYPGAELEGDPSNWWAPNRAALEGAIRAVGFPRCVDRTEASLDTDEPTRYLLTMQAWK